MNHRIKNTLWMILLALALVFIGCQKETEQPNPELQDTSELTEEGGKQVAEEAPEGAKSFPKAPDLPSAPDTLRIAVISDINESYGTVGYSPNVRAAVQDILKRNVDFVVSPGDLVAGQKAGLNYDAMWKAFHYQVGDVFFDNDLEFIMAPGNHDASAFSQYVGERNAMARAFESRRPRSPLLSGSEFPFHYAVKLRDVLVIALDVTKPLSDTDPQLDWLESTIKRNTPARAILVLGHLPLFPIDFGSFWEIASSRRLLDILMAAPSPTLYLSGHHHIFYPAHVGELRLVACPALGAGPRSMTGGRGTGGYVMIEIPPHAPPMVSMRISPDFEQTVDIKTLPVRRILLEREDFGMAEYIMEMLDHSVREVP